MQNQNQDQIQSLKSQLSEAFQGQFMQPEWSFGAYREVEHSHGEKTLVPADVCDSDNAEDFQDYVEGEVESVSERKSGWIYRLSAPGFMDCTDWSIAETEQEALEELLGMADYDVPND